MKKIMALIGAAVLFLGGSVACRQADEDLTVYMPDGAPALALAKLMAEDTEQDGVTYRVLSTAGGSANLIASKLTNKDEEKNADFCVLPLTAASKLVGSGEKYVMLGTVTHGNLYFLSKREGDFALSHLIGKRVGVLQINEVPGLTLKVTLKKAEIPYQEVKNGEEISLEKVNLYPLTGADAVGVGYDDGQGGSILYDYYLVAEPAASFQASKKGYTVVGDLQALYGGTQGYPQAVLVGKKAVVEERAEWTADFTAKIQNSGEWLKTASGETLVSAVAAHMEDRSAQTSLKAPLLTAEAVSRCGIYFTYAKDSVSEIEEFLTRLTAVNPQAAAMPAKEFYWKA